MKAKNLYERNLFVCAQSYSGPNNILFKLLHLISMYFQYYMNKLFIHDVYFKYIEVPITTKCTLKCKECCNLIQFYQDSYQISGHDIIYDIKNLSNIAKKILRLRLLGGEPLLHPELPRIVEQILQYKNIKNIEIVTNGTLTLSREMIEVLIKSERVSIDISNYGEKSIKQKELIAQLENNNIRYSTQKERIFWTAQADCSYRGRNESQLMDVLSKCNMDCISMLNGEIHLCPRSSHGMDLGIIPNNKTDYYNVRQMESIKEGKKNIYRLLNTRSIIACNYCDTYRWKELPQVRAAEQISKKEAKLLLKKYTDAQNHDIY